MTLCQRFEEFLNNQYPDIPHSWAELEKTAGRHSDDYKKLVNTCLAFSMTRSLLEDIDGGKAIDRVDYFLRRELEAREKLEIEWQLAVIARANSVLSYELDELRRSIKTKPHEPNG